MAGPGSAYHLSSFRYAKANTSNGISVPLPREEKSTKKKINRVDRLFAKAEDDYRPGQSSSTSLLIRSNVIPLKSAATGVPRGKDKEANDGFQRTKARSLLAQSVHFGEDGLDEALYADTLTEAAGSIYLPRRRARNPITRVSYEEERRKRREIKDRAKLRAKNERKENVEIEQGNQEASDADEIPEDNEVTRDELKARIAYDIEETQKKLPSGSLLETIHYLASHYYDARGKLYAKQAQSNHPTEDGAQKSRNLLRSFEGNALVALGVFMEEMAKYELMGQEKNFDESRKQADMSKKAQEKLDKVRREIQRNKKRRFSKRKISADRVMVESNWARVPRRPLKKKPRHTTPREDNGGSAESDQSDTSQADDQEMQSQSSVERNLHDEEEEEEDEGDESNESDESDESDESEESEESGDDSSQESVSSSSGGSTSSTDVSVDV